MGHQERERHAWRLPSLEGVEAEAEAEAPSEAEDEALGEVTVGVAEVEPKLPPPRLESK
jgi:hypothetical protein